MTQIRYRIVIIGAGAIGANFEKALRDDPSFECAYFDSRESPSFPEGASRRLSSIADVTAWKPDLVVECAGHRAVSSVVPAILREGHDVVISSVGALAAREVRDALSSAALEGQASIVPIAGAVGGIDALAAAARSGLTEVRYTGRKPPLAWRNTPAERQVDLDALATATVIFSGTADEAALLYPQNANVAATVALHGIGFEHTAVTLIADPGVALNCHEIYAKGGSGELRVANANYPSPDNPKTSWLAALSLQATVIERLKGLQMEIPA